MAIQLKSMKGKEFVRMVLAGERDFSEIKLEEGFDLSGYEGFKEMQDYLGAQNLRDNPIMLNDSEVIYVKARGLYLPFVKANKANLNRANLNGASLNRANLNGASLNRASLDGANLIEANLNRANLNGASLNRANLKNIKSLENAIYLENAHFLETRVTSKERKIIETALLRIKLFVVEE